MVQAASRYHPSAGMQEVDAGRATLSRGDSGEGVAELQRRLNAAGANPPLVVDGLFGPKTEGALRKFQLAAGQSPSGQVDRSTFERTAAPAPKAPDPTQAAPSGAVPARALIQGDDARRTTERRAVDQAKAGELGLPPRRADAMSGSQFLEATKTMTRADREKAILREIQAGNVPDFARQMKEVQVSSTGPDGQRHTGTIRVMPDYLAIGSDKDFVRIPMDPKTAQAIADQTGTSLPTKKIVDDVYKQAEVKLRPQPLPAGPQMMSNDYYARHQALVEQQRGELGAPLGALTAGDQKDVVITNRLDQHPGRVAIYGWHQPNGKPIQPLSTVHEDSYADYSHGVRLVGGTMLVDGVERPIAEVMGDPNLAGLVSDEGVIRRTRYEPAR